MKFRTLLLSPWCDAAKAFRVGCNIGHQPNYAIRDFLLRMSADLAENFVEAFEKLKLFSLEAS